MSYDIQDIKDKITIPELLRKLGIECPDRLDCMIKSPLREERSASFHIFDQGKRGHDFGGDFKGDVIDLYRAIVGCDVQESMEMVAGFAGVGKQEVNSRSLHAPKVNRRKKVAIPQPYVWDKEVEEFAHEACSRLLCNQSGDMNTLMIKKGWSFATIKGLAEEGSLGLDKDGKVLYIYPEGIKKRWDVHSSRGDRWLYGKARDNLWRGNDLVDINIHTVYLTEGESDLISLLNYNVDNEAILSCSVSGASWSPEPVMCHKVAAHRSIYLMFDCDQAGFDLTMRIADSFKQHAVNCHVHALSWKKIAKEMKLPKSPDLGDINLNQLKEKIDNYFIIV